MGSGVTDHYRNGAVVQQGRELIRREAVYRGERAPLELAGKTAILVDDGPSTGSSMMATVLAIRELEPEDVVIAVPESTCREFATMVDDVVCASMPTPFTAVGASYWDFTQFSDEEVRTLLGTPTVTRVLRRRRAADAVRHVALPAPESVPKYESDAKIHLDVTTGLEPLEPTSTWIQGQTPETYPSGL